MKGFLDTFKRKAFQRKAADVERNKNVRLAIVQLSSEGPEIDGILAIFIKNGRIYVMEGGLQDDFEAQVLVQRAQYLINNQGLITQ